MPVFENCSMWRTAAPMRYLGGQRISLRMAYVISEDASNPWKFLMPSGVAGKR